MMHGCPPWTTPPVNLSCSASQIHPTRLLTDMKRIGCQERVTVRPGKINQLGALVRKARPCALHTENPWRSRNSSAGDDQLERALVLVLRYAHSGSPG